MSKLTKIFNRRLAAFLAVILILAGMGAGGTVAYLRNDASQRPLIYSEDALLYETWVNYKANYVEENSNRTVDRQQNNITTSEGQSYTMMRAVWVDDKDTFDRSWEWTQGYLQRPSDKLFSWKYGERADGSYGILTDIGGQNTASDADVDLALALLMAYGRWGNDYYLREAKTIIPSIWEKEVVVVAGKPVLAANDLEKGKANIVVNPSYLAPYAYKKFAQVDTTNNWTALADNSYNIIESSSANTLGGEKSSGLPPNWVTVNVTTGAYTAVNTGDLNTNYGYDAIRTPWRLALDYSWNKDERAKNLLEKFSFLSDEYERTGKLDAIYTHSGDAVANYEAPAVYGTAIGYYKVVNPSLAQRVYNEKLATLYDPNTQGWKERLNYYDDNWAWFGTALYQNALPDLTEALK